MKKTKLIVATSFHENRPVSLGDVGLWSKRINGEEEMLLQAMSLSAITTRAGARIEAEADVVRHLLQRRVRDGQTITQEWVEEHVGSVNGTLLISYLRTGQGLAPGETLDRPTFEPIEFEGRVFRSLALNYREILAAAKRSDDLDALNMAEEAQALGDQVELQEGETADQMFGRVHREALEMHARASTITRATADLLADNLNARIADHGAPIDGAWLLSLLPSQAMGEITTYLRNGSTPEDEPEEGETPKTEADAAASS